MIAPFSTGYAQHDTGSVRSQRREFLFCFLPAPKPPRVLSPRQSDPDVGSNERQRGQNY